MATTFRLSIFELSLLGVAGLIFLRGFRKRSYVTPLFGPSRPGWLYGYQRRLVADETEVAAAALLQNWAKEYGDVFALPWSLGSNKIVLIDPKAVAHFFALDTYGYVQTSFIRNSIELLFGPGVLTVEGDVHKQQRKAMNPSFSPASMKEILPVFYDASYKLKTAWDSTLESNHQDGATIEVGKWMAAIALDSVGLGGFSHDFGTLDGKTPRVLTAMDSFGEHGGDKTVMSPFMFLLAPVLPLLLKLPIGGQDAIGNLRKDLNVVGSALLERVRKEQEIGVAQGDKSVIGVLIRSESTEASIRMSPDEIQGQNTLLIAGYLTTATSLTWALINLSRYPEKQTRLREELLQLGPNDPTYEQLSSAIVLPYLDAVVHEILRLHPAVPDTTREAHEDDVMPLSTPIVTATGQTVSSIAIPKGTSVTIPILAINTSENFWGPDAKIFRPERWLESDSKLATDIQSYRHILTFVAGTRECLGKNFAIAEFKAVLSVLIRNYTFEFPNGPDTEIIGWRGLVTKPRVVGEEGAKVPLVVRRFN
ncbi:cytochrome P450 [Mycena floridula]|nr:cytochrome P450 [Mycena floridula]